MTHILLHIRGIISSRKHFLTILAAFAVTALFTLSTSVGAEPGQAASSPKAPPAVSTPMVELVKALAWPIVALSIAVTFRRVIRSFVIALGSRITKLSLFKIELQLVPAASASGTQLPDSIRTATYSEISDVTMTMLEQLESGASADFALVKLGEGREWITSRLYIAAVMMERMCNSKVFVFVEPGPTTERRFLAVATLGQLRWALAKRYPWLEAAWTRSVLSVFPYSGQTTEKLPDGAIWIADPSTLSSSSPLITSDTGTFARAQVRPLMSEFIRFLQSEEVKKEKEPEWTKIHDKVWERAVWVTRDLLVSLLPQEAFHAWTNVLRDSPRAHLTRAVLRRNAPFVALVEGEREFLRLVNRQALLDEIAASLGEEPESVTH